MNYFRHMGFFYIYILKWHICHNHLYYHICYTWLWLNNFSFTSSSKQCTNRRWSCSQSLKSRGRKGKQRICMKGKWHNIFTTWILLHKTEKMFTSLTRLLKYPNHKWWYYLIRMLHISLLKEESICSFTMSWISSSIHFSEKGRERKKSRQQKKQSERESGRKTLRCVPPWLWPLTYKWKHDGRLCF